MMPGSFDVGAYSVTEAARLIGTPPAMLRRWVVGYGNYRKLPPLWTLQHDIEDTPFLGFRDLIEARMVSSLRQAGISLQAIRYCMQNAHEIIGDSHVFSSARFRTDGKTIWLESTKGIHEPELIDLKSRQHVFHSAVAPSFRDLEFDDEAAIRWWPLPGKTSIVIDPLRNFGQPSIAETGIPTARIAEAFESEGRSLARIAKLYEVSREAARDALKFEEQLAQQSQTVPKAA